MKTYTEISYFSNWQNEDIDNPFSYSSTQVILWGLCESKWVKIGPSNRVRSFQDFVDSKAR